MASRTAMHGTRMAREAVVLLGQPTGAGVTSNAPLT